ncbi:MAG: hypothetical protein JO247_16215 [Chloroflexi bacterium]|nr:hypothetical protein [Chloroflexota bacterium]
MAEKLVQVLSVGLFGRREAHQPRPIVVLRRDPATLLRPPSALNAAEAERLGEFALSFLH